MSETSHHPEKLEPDLPLNERQQIVLASIVQRYIGNGEPVGSRQVSKDIPDSLSPATIRNVMADMEDLGLIAQPHTSAGRQPTELGYRVWIDQIMPREIMTNADREIVNQSLGQARTEEQLLAAASLALAEVTRQLGVAISPMLDETRLERLELVPVGDRMALLVASFGSGLIRSVTMEFDAPVERNDLMVLVARVHLASLGRTPTEIRRQLAEPSAILGPEVDPGLDDLVRRVLEGVVRLAHPERPNEAYMQGASNVFSQPELGDRGSLAGLVQLLEDRRQLAQILEERVGHEGVYITIGSEHRLETLRSLSLVTRNYRLGEARGTLGVVGPTRMPYGKLISAVEYIAMRLTQG